MFGSRLFPLQAVNFVVKPQCLECKVGSCTFSNCTYKWKKPLLRSIPRLRKTVNQQDLIKRMFFDESILMSRFQFIVI